MKDEEACDDSIPPQPISRRQFTLLSIAAGMAATTRLDAAPTVSSVSMADVEIRTPSGVCDAALAHQTSAGHWPTSYFRGSWEMRRNRK